MSMEQILAWNNQGVALMTSSTVQGRQAMGCFQKALDATFQLGNANSSCSPKSTILTSSSSGNGNDNDILTQVCRLVTVPMASGLADDSSLYFFGQALALHPLTPSILMRRSTQDSAAIVNDFVQMSLLVLSMNTALACYQLGRACWNRRGKNVVLYETKAKGFFLRAAQLYQDVLPMLGVSQESLLGTAVVMPRLVATVTLAAKNNLMLLRMELGWWPHAKQALVELMWLLEAVHQQQQRQQSQSQQQQFVECDAILEEFALNTTVLQAAGSWSFVTAGAA